METEAFPSSCFCLSAFHLKHPPLLYVQQEKAIKWTGEIDKGPSNHLLNPLSFTFL
ncbi:hypothetical protein HMPREF9137_1232 [Prevotella denticola F0289]|nr:hypothetical protein HMPREF9137_1232 [Prevotella denticola F0289]